MKPGAEASRFLLTFAQALANMALYAPGHPTRANVGDAVYTAVRSLLGRYPHPVFTFLDDEVVFNGVRLTELRGWHWASRLSEAGIQRLELDEHTDRATIDQFLDSILARVGPASLWSADAPEQTESMALGGVRFGTIGLRGERELAEVRTASTWFTLDDEASSVRSLHHLAGAEGRLPVAEVEAVVSSLAVAMQSGHQVMTPLLQLKEFDQYTTAHSMNIAVLAMGLADYVGWSSKEVHALGVAGLLHDIGKVRVPEYILNKAGRLSPEEREAMNMHPVDGARIILESSSELEFAATVAYEHHIQFTGGGYPQYRYTRQPHPASRLVQVCDVYDALRTNRPYRGAWESERVLGMLLENSGTEFDPDFAEAFVEMMRAWEEGRSEAEADPNEAPPQPEIGAPAAVPAS